MLIAELLERSARATPAEIERLEAGALLRYTGEPSHWWAGASLLHGDDVEAMVAAAEAFAADRGTRPQVHVCAGCPDGLDDELAGRGYRRHTDVLMMTSTPADVLMVGDQATVPLAAAPAAVELTRRPQPSWFGEQTMRMLARVDALSAYAAVTENAVALAVGRVVVDDGWAGVFSMRTLEGARRRGYARAVLAGLATWAGDHAGGLYLQVRLADEPARSLYRQMGFVETGRYHYREAPG